MFISFTKTIKGFPVKLTKNIKSCDINSGAAVLQKHQVKQNHCFIRRPVAGVSFQKQGLYKDSHTHRSGNTLVGVKFLSDTKTKEDRK